jgi:alkylhydroperoxidase family enzyme
MDLRRYELVTLAAARRLRSSYCCLAHGTALLKLGEPVLELALDHHAAGLDEVDVAVMDLAEKVVADATSVEEADRERPRGLGLSDADILDVVLAASARCFFSKTLDAVGARADADYLGLDPELREALVVGRPIAEA